MQINHSRRRAAAGENRRNEMLRELTSVRSALDEAYMRFNAAVDPELVEACVYEINAAEARYGYLLRLVRESGGEAAFSGKEDVSV